MSATSVARPRFLEFANSRRRAMFSGMILAIAVLAIVIKCGYDLGELSLSAALLIAAIWLIVCGVTIAMNWPPAVILVASVVLAVGSILAVFGGDLRIR